MIETDRLVTPETDGAESHQDWAIRPTSFAEYQGQDAVRDQMQIFIEAAKGRGESLDHTLIAAGMGKTTLRTLSPMRWA